MGGKYVPPHLRNKQAAAGEGGAAPSSSETAGRSLESALASQGPAAASTARWNNPRDGHSHHHNNNNNHHHHNDAANASDGPELPVSSRWSQVDRDNLGSEGGNNRNNHNSNRNYRRNRSCKILFFGDSFIRLFSLMQSEFIHVEGFKGGSAKGIGREGNENREKIVKLIKQKRPERMVFCFGSVDVHLSYYYTKITKDETLDFEPIAKDYVDFVSTLTELVPANMITIVGIYPSALNDEDVRQSLMAYGTADEETKLLVKDEDIANEKRQNRVRTYNGFLEESCKKYGFNFANAFDDVIDPETNQMKASFRDVSDTNIHVVWETTVLLWMKRWPWYKELAQPGFEAGLQKTLDEYLLTKPWAKRTHVASTLGVQGAVKKDQGPDKDEY